MCCDCMTSSVNMNVPILVIAIDGRGLLENFIEKDSCNIRGREWFGCRVPSQSLRFDGCRIDLWDSINSAWMDP